ncbi:RNA polymerase sigma-70 factor [Puteibacter caeruleilacunae]|nr:RNA polymerase sigma-70 factor [Puteibacter caeruleilacunae]
MNDSDQKSFEKLFDVFYSRLFLFANSFLSNEMLAKEVVMDVFVKLWERRDQLDRIDNLETYLYVTVRNNTYNYLRTEKNKKFDLLEDVHIDVAKYEYTPETKYISQEEVEKINAAIEELPPKCKMVFKLIREEGLKRNEVAKVLDISVKTVDNQVATAVKKIAETLNIDLSAKDRYINLQSFLLSL